MNSRNSRLLFFMERVYLPVMWYTVSMVLKNFEPWNSKISVVVALNIMAQIAPIKKQK